MEITRRRALVALVWGLAPFVLTVYSSSYVVVNTVVVDYDYLDFAAIILGLAAIVFAARTVVRPAGAPVWARWVAAVVLVLGLFHLVRGTGVLTDLGTCGSWSVAGTCTPIAPE